jgi:hypothetical protein
MFEVIFAAVLIAATIGFAYSSFQLRDKHPFLSVMFFELSIIFVWVGFSASVLIAEQEDAVSAPVLQLLNSLSGNFVWIVVFTLAYFMIIYVRDLLGSIGKSGGD